MKFDASKTPAKGKASGSGKKSAPPPAPRPTISLDTWLDIAGAVMLGIAAVTILGLLSTQRSSMISDWLGLVSRLFGWGAYIAPLILGMVGLVLLIRRFGSQFPRLAPARLVGVVIAYFAALATLHGLAMTATGQDGGALAAQSQGGGEVGWLLVSALIGLVGNVGAVLFIALAWGGAVMLMAQLSFQQLALKLQHGLARVPTRPTDDIIEPDYGQGEGARDDGELKINGLRPRRSAKRPADPSDPNLPPARPISNASAPTARIQTIGAPASTSASNQAPININVNPPKGRTGEANRMPAPRVIGAADAGVKGQRSEARSQPAQPATAGPQPAAAPAPAPPPVPEISSRMTTQRDWAPPRIEELLEQGNDASLKEADIRKRVAVIEDTLKAFSVPGRVVEVNRGPTITQFGVEPGFNEMRGGKQVKVKVSRIAGLADDLALALAAPRIRIEAPVPGRAIVGIEVPNGETSLVSLRDVMESEEFERLERKTRLRLALGQDVSGHPVVADMTTMPHLLIAGTTGSGKSVCVNAIIVALLCNNTPDDLRFLMIDPKRVELTGYNGIPHLIAPVVVDLEKTTAVLQWVAREMDGRYRTFAKHGVRNIVDFNAKVAAEGSVATNKAIDPDLKKLPYIVVVIDELADLMMMAPDETEKIICRLAQMARATGIHLILATQRPSVDVVTGLIKANFPARIAFTVATTVDSRVILDGPGAEKLLGRGDMLVVTPEQSSPMRAQGCFLNEKEITRVVRHWRAQFGTHAGTDPINAAMTAPSIPMKGTLDAPQEAALPELPMNDIFSNPSTWDEARALDEAAKEVNSGNKDDKLFNDAVATVRLQGKASISLLQRRLRIGYSRAARLIEEMEERGIVGPSVPGQQHREVLNSPLTGADEP
jgi:S-DNA-T family DNA segregation ATPase FtsK/SpoIIIE